MLPCRLAGVLVAYGGVIIRFAGDFALTMQP